jgi:hypothetical protein
LSVVEARARARWLLLIGAVLLVATAAAVYWGCSRSSRSPEPAPIIRGPPGTVGSVWASDAAAREAKFPLRLSDDRRHLVDQSGVPFFIQGEAAWSLVAQLERADVELYLEDRKRRGFNLLMVNLLEHHFSEHPPTNAYGIAPFSRAGDFERRVLRAR